MKKKNPQTKNDAEKVKKNDLVKPREDRSQKQRVTKGRTIGSSKKIDKIPKVAKLIAEIIQEKIAREHTL